MKMRIYLVLFLKIFIHSANAAFEKLYLYNGTYFDNLNNINIDDYLPKDNNLYIDYGPCTCDLLTDYCDYRCCCDLKCIPYIKKWEENNLCLNIDYNKLSNYSCHGRHGLKNEKKDSFEWNTINSPLLYTDQISKLMCVRHDRTRNKIEEYYKNNDDIDLNLLDFIKQSSYYQNGNQNENQNENLFRLAIQNKPVYNIGPYGKKLKKAEFEVLKPIEGFFIISNESATGEEINIVLERGDYNYLKKIIIKIDPNNINNNIILLELISDTEVKKTHITILYNSNKLNENNEQEMIVSGNPGYLVGKNVLFSFEENNEAKLYNNGFFIYGAKEDGSCMLKYDDDNVVNIQSIKFKQNSIYSCKYYITDCYDFELLKIFESAENFEGKRIGKYGNSKIKTDNIYEEWINVDYKNLDINPFLNIAEKCNFPTKIYLEILVTKFLTKGQPQEMIVGAKIYYSTEEIDLNEFHKISFITKFVVISEELFENSDKQSSLYPITNDEIKKP